MKQIFKNAIINGKKCDIAVENGKFTEIGVFSEAGIDLENKKVIPGLIDIHTHGCIGNDTMDGDTLNEISLYMAKNGITAFLPTTMTVGMDEIKNVVNQPDLTTDGAKILGFHLEGPYINVNRKGAQNEKYVRIPDIDEFNSLQNIKIVTIAPEVENAQEFIKACKNAVVSIGHTDADYHCTVEAIENGANCLTHTFNVMPPLTHRAPGPIGAAIDKNIFVQVICDGVHIHKSVITMLYRTFGRERMILISDSMRATGMTDGNYEFGGQTIIVKESVARTLEGAVAGSTSNLMMGVKKAIEFGIPEEDAIYMATRTPAILLNENRGLIEKGFEADFVVLDDNFDVSMTVVGGKIVYKH